MIYNRTQADVDNAISLRSRLQKGETLTSDEVLQLERGTLTINTLNRIEEKQTELKNLFNLLGYYNVEIVNTVWNYNDYFKQSDFERIRDNCEKLKTAFFTFSYTPKKPDSNFRKYQTINDVEKILYDLDVMINDVKSKYRQCGTFQCGEENQN